LAGQYFRGGLDAVNGQFGLQTMCIGHGMATATIVERLPR